MSKKSELNANGQQYTGICCRQKAIRFNIPIYRNSNETKERKIIDNMKIHSSIKRFHHDATILIGIEDWLRQCSPQFQRGVSE